jgi:hypothetical protein
MDEYYPKKCYSGTLGYVNYFLDSVNSLFNQNLESEMMKKKYRREYLNYLNTIRNLVLIERQQHKIEKEIKTRMKKIFYEYINQFQNGAYTKKTCYFLDIDEFYDFTITITIGTEYEEKFKYLGEDYQKYCLHSKNKIHRLNNIEFSKEEKNVYELIYVLKEYCQNEKYLNFDCILNTYWDEPFVEFE